MVIAVELNLHDRNVRDKRAKRAERKMQLA
jgi:hypothetical protein